MMIHVLSVIDLGLWYFSLSWRSVLLLEETRRKSPTCEFESRSWWGVLAWNRHNNVADSIHVLARERHKM